MRQSGVLGGLLILVALVLGIIFALGLFQWETSARAEEARLHPTATARPPAPTVTATSPSTDTPTLVPSDTPTLAPTDTAIPSPSPGSPTATLASGQPSPTPAATTAPTVSATPTPTAPVAPSATPAGGASSALVATGARVFAANCNACHPKANAGVGPALHGSAFTARFPDDGPLKLLIRTGHNVMPSFSPAVISDADLNAIVAYLRSLK
ncbi:MAG TPA: c-type cytochrome [Chloroflexota bacterium]|nr:c-type cytochrome [Chloroflexota bacterium]